MQCVEFKGGPALDHEETVTAGSVCIENNKAT